MDPQLTIAPGHIDIHVWGERFATYNAAASVPGFSAVHALGLRAVMQPFTPVGNCLWVGHGNVNGIAYGLPDRTAAAVGRNRIGRASRTQRLTVRRISAPMLVDRAGWQLYLAGPSGPFGWHRVHLSGAILDFRIVLTAASDDIVTLGSTEGFTRLRLYCAASCYLRQVGQLRNSLDDFGREGYSRQTRVLVRLQWCCWWRDCGICLSGSPGQSVVPFALDLPGERHVFRLLRTRGERRS